MEPSSSVNPLLGLSKFSLYFLTVFYIYTYIQYCDYIDLHCCLLSPFLVLYTWSSHIVPQWPYHKRWQHFSFSPINSSSGDVCPWQNVQGPAMFTGTVTSQIWMTVSWLPFPLLWLFTRLCLSVCVGGDDSSHFSQHFDQIRESELLSAKKAGNSRSVVTYR